MKQSGSLKLLVQCLGHEEESVQHASLRALGSIVSSDDSDEYTRYIVNMGALDKIIPILEQNVFQTRTMIKEACWMMSNIAAGTQEHIDHMIQAEVFPSLIKLFKKAAPLEIHKEVAWVLKNVTEEGNPEQIEYLVNKGFIKPLVRLLHLDRKNWEIVLVALEALSNILQCGKDINNDNQFVHLAEAAHIVDSV